ncbi:MAG: hypothetical protein NTZ05_14980 [Chloroflexi bacterium]|nr:hypothetical protein [Chloroflexota bacterium]
MTRERIPSGPDAAPIAESALGLPVYDLGVIVFPAPAHRNYRVVSGAVSIRAQPDPECADEVAWAAGDIMGPAGRDYPGHLLIDALLFSGAIVPVEEEANG